MCFPKRVSKILFRHLTVLFILNLNIYCLAMMFLACFCKITSVQLWLFLFKMMSLIIVALILRVGVGGGVRGGWVNFWCEYQNISSVATTSGSANLFINFLSNVTQSRWSVIIIKRINSYFTRGVSVLYFYILRADFSWCPCMYLYHVCICSWLFLLNCYCVLWYFVRNDEIKLYNQSMSKSIMISIGP